MKTNRNQTKFICSCCKREVEKVAIFLDLSTMCIDCTLSYLLQKGVLEDDEVDCYIYNFA